MDWNAILQSTTATLVRTIVGNNKVFSDTIQNFSANPYRRVDLTATIHGSVGHHHAIRLLKEGLARIPNAHPDHYWQVYFDTNRLIREAFGEAGFPAPRPGYHVTGTFGPFAPVA